MLGTPRPVTLEVGPPPVGATVGGFVVVAVTCTGVAACEGLGVGSGVGVAREAMVMPLEGFAIGTLPDMLGAFGSPERSPGIIPIKVLPLASFS
jgi:hypothetical protein